MSLDTQLPEKIANYIAKTQPLLDKQAEAEMIFNKRAMQTAGVLVNRGIIPQTKADVFADKVAEDQTVVFDYIEKLATLIPVDDLGNSVRVKQAAGDDVDPFEAEFFGAGTTDSGSID